MVVAEQTGYQAFLCNTVTGKVTTFFPPSKVSWGSRLNGAGPVQASLKVTAEELRNLDLHMATMPLRQSLGVAYDGSILECGPIWEQDYDADAEELALTASGLWSVFDVRKVLQGDWTTSPTWSVVNIQNRSLGAIARELVRLSIEDTPFTRPDGSGAGALNVVLPPDTPGTHQRTYNGYDLGWTGERLRQLTGVEGGPDIRFRPQFKGGDRTVVEWVLETGTEEQPLLSQAGPDWIWDTAVSESGVVRLGVKRDATGLAARVYVPGNGQERNMRVAWATDTTLVDAGFPWTEADEAAKDVESETVLQDHADRLLADHRAPWDTWTLQVRADQHPRLGQYLPGDWAQINVGPGHPMVPAGLYRVRIMAVDGDHTATVKLTVAPIQGRL